MIDPAIEPHYGTGYERIRLFPGGTLAAETEPALLGFSPHFIAAATRPQS